MHRPIEDGLEDYLSGRAEPAKMKRFHDHLGSCDGCRSDLQQYEAQAHLIRSLRVLEDVEPAPGFYARVIERIEAQRAASYWSLFMEPAVSRQLMYATFSLLLVLASAIWSTGSAGNSQTMAATPIGVMAVEMPVADGADVQRDRSVVLTNFASYGTGAGEPASSGD